MSNALQFTAISGANSEDAVCYILEIDDAKILLDCGSYEDYAGEGLAQLQRVAPQVDAVLLSHPDLAHVGAYALAYSQYGLTCAAYATQATQMMGRLCMLDVVKTLAAREEFSLFDEKDVDAAFESVTALQYFQPKALPGKHSGIVITAHSAGHTIGGTIWTISNGAEVVLYALDFNHMKEGHLNRSSLMEGGLGMVNQRLMRPTLLITDSYNALYSLPTRKQRIECFLGSVGDVIKHGGNVLIPVDSAARVLEVAHILNDWWPHDKMRRDTHVLCLLSGYGRRVRSFAQSLVGWMSGGIESQMSDRDAKPFDLRYVTIVQSLEELDRRVRKDSRPRGRSRRAVVLAPLEGMSTGLSQELFLRWAGDRKNAVILPQRGPPSSLARQLYTRWWDRTQTRRTGGSNDSSADASSVVQLAPPVRLSRSTISVTVKKRVQLEGEELDNWIVQEKRRKEQEAAREALLKRKRDMLDDDDVSSASESDDDATERRIGMAAAIGDVSAVAFSEIDLETERLLSGQSFDLYVRGRGPVRGLYLENKSYCMFPFQEMNRRTDEYGEIYELEKYMVKLDTDDATLALDADKPYESDDGGKKESRPTKAVVEERRVQLNCQLSFVDIEGRADGTSVRNILALVMPKRLVIVHGSSAGTKALADYCRDPGVQVTKEIYTPRVGEILNVSSGVNVYRSRLTDTLFKQVRMASVQDSMVGFVSGRVRYAQGDQVPTLDRDGTGLQSAWHPTVLVGDPRLSALRSVLGKQGITALFDSEGSLVCNNVVAIRRGAGKHGGPDTLQVLGNPSADYYHIRAVVYSHFAAL
ncbi:hypothetical protein LPJ61_000927 [Coemansia biformis]|uniref:Cleavage and polyadenylation specificity factor subunit 2 n=1 Tax=Coemansia biformis TaxID=1286918 RepID=A0A9W7YHS1_9FUNG|nr:hypothetical protein LPJ61_000927 [Coemansia biformis]